MSKLVEELRELAQAATPGPWRTGNAYDKSFFSKHQILVDTSDGPYVILEGNNHFPKDCAANVAFAAAANPGAVLELLAHIERLEANQIPEGHVAVPRGDLQTALDDWDYGYQYAGDYIRKKYFAEADYERLRNLLNAATRCEGGGVR